jgi:thiaminase
MNFYEKLDQETRNHQQELLEIPSLTAALGGNITRESYVSFLEEAYHHVKHTAAILMAAGSRLRPDQQWAFEAIAEYIDEEKGHHEWILNDIAACGEDAEAVRNGEPRMPCELFVSYIYDRITRVNPMCVFGMVHVLEGTSIKLATEAADRIRESLGLPKEAFSYLYSHGSLDLEHYEFFKKLMADVTNPTDQSDILHTAKVAFKLYSDMLRSLPWTTLKQTA